MIPEITIKRFWDKVDKSGDCWLWRAAKDRAGYGRFWFLKRLRLAHHVSVILSGREIPAERCVDHLCRNPSCVRPAHLEVVTILENTMRGRLAQVNAERGAAITHCPKGHAYNEANTYRNPRGARVCRACHNQRTKEAKQAKRRT